MSNEPPVMLRRTVVGQKPSRLDHIRLITEGLYKLKAISFKFLRVRFDQQIRMTLLENPTGTVQSFQFSSFYIHFDKVRNKHVPAKGDIIQGNFATSHVTPGCNVAFYDLDVAPETIIVRDVLSQFSQNAWIAFEGSDPATGQLRQKECIVSELRSDIETIEAGPAKSPKVFVQFDFIEPEKHLRLNREVQVEPNPPPYPDR